MRRNVLQGRRRPLHICRRREASTGLIEDNCKINLEAFNHISEESWRTSSREHSIRIRDILAPGLTPLDHPLNTGLQRQQRQRERKEQRRKQRNLKLENEQHFSARDSSPFEKITALDPKHPVYNFLIEYYGLKGTKGVRRLMKWPPGISNSTGGSFLEGATEQDFFTSFHAKGAGVLNFGGVVFSPMTFVYGNEPNKFQQDRGVDGRIVLENGQSGALGNQFRPPPSNGGPLAPFLWYRTLLQQTIHATPILHCYGLHEWAMQYHPKTSQLPPRSSKYQSHLKLRIDQETLNETVEQNTLFCSHVDAYKFFKEALPKNQFGKRRLPTAEERPEWLLQSEQPACVHTTMDLLKMAMKLGPFCDPNLFCRVLEVVVDARSLDVAASPYDVMDYGVDPIPIETPQGRNEYKQNQLELMKKAHPIRRDLLQNYQQFLSTF